MRIGIRRRSVLYIAAAVAGSAWATPRENNEDIEVVTLGVLRTPLDGCARPSTRDGKTGPDGAQETLTRLVEELRSKDVVPDTAATGSAATKALRQESAELHTPEEAHPVEKKRVAKKAVKELKEMSPSGTQPSGDVKSLEDSSRKRMNGDFNEADITKATTETIKTDPFAGAGDVSSLDTQQPEEHIGGGKYSVKKQREYPVTDESQPLATRNEANANFVASASSVPLDEHSFDERTLTWVEERPKPIEGARAAEGSTVNLITLNDSNPREDAEIENAASDGHEAATTIAGASFINEAESVVDDDTIGGAVAIGTPERGVQGEDPCDALSREVSHSETSHVNCSEAAGAVDAAEHISFGNGNAGEEAALKAVEDTAGAVERGADDWTNNQKQCSGVQNSAIMEFEQNTSREASFPHEDEGEEGDCCPGGGVDSESTTTNVAQVRQGAWAENGEEVGRTRVEATDQSSTAIGLAVLSSGAGEATGNLEKDEEEPTSPEKGAAPVATAGEVSPLGEPMRRTTQGDGAPPAKAARNGETLPSVAANTEVPGTVPLHNAGMGKGAPNDEEEGAARKHPVSRYNVRSEKRKGNGEAGGVPRSLPETRLNDVTVSFPSPPISPVNTANPAFRARDDVQGDLLQGKPVVRTSWWDTWGAKCVVVTQKTTLRWAELAGEKRRAFTVKVLAVAKALMAKTWNEFVEPSANHVWRRLGHAARSLLDEVGRHLADAQLIEVL